MTVEGRRDRETSLSDDTKRSVSTLFLPRHYLFIVVPHAAMPSLLLLLEGISRSCGSVVRRKWLLSDARERGRSDIFQ